MRGATLYFHPVSEGQCMEYKCTGAGRYAPMICGHVLPAEGAFALEGQRLVICRKHRKEWETTWDGALDDARKLVAA